MTVISLADARKAREAAQREELHWSGPCVCLGCRHEWVGVGPVGAHSELHCPSCLLPKGTVKHPFGADAGDMVLVCDNCDGEALTSFVREGLHYVLCMGCGTDLTDVFFT